MPAAWAAGTVPFTLWPAPPALENPTNLPADAQMQAEESSVAVRSLGPRHIIERPRLTRMLDETSARIIILHAPAGYGKTTLARQWTSAPGRRAAWYRCTTASTDVAALAVGLADAAATIVPRAGERMLERLRASAQPEDDVAVLLELLLQDLAAWPSDAWLVIDDYHFVIPSPGCDRFVAELGSDVQIRLLLTSRRRPAWVNARGVLYGNVALVDRRDLTMTDQEARIALPSMKEEAAHLLAERAAGWPAVIGLAGLIARSEFPADRFPNALYEFLAEELYQAVSDDVRRGLGQLSLSPVLTRRVAETMLGHERGRRVVTEAAQFGLLQMGPGETLEMHPLLFELFAKKYSAAWQSDPGFAERLATVLMADEDWDAAFIVARRSQFPPLLIRVVEEALPRLLAEGRSATLARWLEDIDEIGVEAPIFELADAELALRQGILAKAEALACTAAETLDANSANRSRAFAVAGQAAHLSDREEAALEYHRRARETARTEHDTETALWGQFIAALQLESAEADSLLHELELVFGSTTKGRIRLATAGLLLASKFIGLRDVDDLIARLSHLVAKRTDPLAHTAFLNAFAYALVSAAYFSEALPIIDRELHEAGHYRLDFVIPHANLVKAGAYIGLQRHTEADRLLREIQARATDHREDYLDISVRGLRARVELSRGDPAAAVNYTKHRPQRVLTRGLHGEYLACHALALACLGAADTAVAVADEAEAMTSALEARTLTALTRAVTLVTGQSPDDETFQNCWRTVAEGGNYDLLITACRASPSLLSALWKLPEANVTVETILRRVGDERLSRIVGVVGASSISALSPREHEVAALLTQGLPNREIARALFISEKTVKAHLRHVYEKLGVRGRTEAALRYAQLADRR